MGNKDGVVREARAGVILVVLSVLCLGLDSSEGIKILGSPNHDVFSGSSPKADLKPSVKMELSRIYPLVFFKPPFACATSD
jgi:hypothetical protein